MAFIEVKEIFKSYLEADGVKTDALRGISLVINKGDFISIAGPSGSGKTTLLNLIGALDNPDAGKIYYSGKEITAFSLSQLADFRLYEIGFVFQAYNLINTLSALENTEYVMLLQGKNAKNRRQRAEDILKKLGLDGFLHRRVNQLSGGQQQRVAVARAIAAGSKVILADEPTANLDSVTAGELINLMHRLNREEGITFIFSTHDKMVMEKADKIFYIKDGKILN